MIHLHHDNDFFDSRPLPALPHVKPFFFVPPLEDKPQNPIMDSLKIEEANINLPKRTTRTKSRVETETKDRGTLPGSVEETKRMLWTEAAMQKTQVPVAFSQLFPNLIPRVYRLDYCLGTDFEGLIRSRRRELHFCQNKTNICGFLHGISEPLWKQLLSSLEA